MCSTIKRQDKAIIQSVVIQAVLWQVTCELLTKQKTVVSRIAKSCVIQAVIVIIVVSVKCEQLHRNSANSKQFLSEIICN